MNIREIMREEYAHAVEVAEKMAPEFPAGSLERERWLFVAQSYRQFAGDLAAEQEPAEWNRPALGV